MAKAKTATRKVAKKQTSGSSKLAKFGEEVKKMASKDPSLKNFPPKRRPV